MKQQFPKWVDVEKEVRNIYTKNLNEGNADRAKNIIRQVLGTQYKRPTYKLIIDYQKLFAGIQNQVVSDIRYLEKKKKESQYVQQNTIYALDEAVTTALNILRSEILSGELNEAERKDFERILEKIDSLPLREARSSNLVLHFEQQDLNTYNEIVEAANKINKMFIDMYSLEIGSAFEQASNQVFNKLSDSQINELISIFAKEQMVVNYTAQDTGRDSVDSVIPLGGDGNITIHYDKWGKADIRLSFGLPESQLSLSLKSWNKNFPDHNFNPTKLEAALRRVWVNGDQAYKNDYFISSSGGIWTNADKVASLALVVDTVLGATQGIGSRADFIVIDAHSDSDSDIKVYSVFDVLNAVHAQIENNHLVPSYEEKRAQKKLSPSDLLNTEFAVIPSYIGINI